MMDAVPGAPTCVAMGTLYDACRTPPSLQFEAVARAGSGLATAGGALAARGPGSACVVCSPITSSPLSEVKRQTRLSLVSSPPASSHGSQKLYECPSLPLL